MPQHRILSLLPAATEIVCALGLESQLVGRSHECNYPEIVKELPACTEASIPRDQSTLESSPKVEEILTNALSAYNVNIEKVKQLQPDIVITKAQGAVSLTKIEQALSSYLQKPSHLLSLQPVLLEEVFTNVTEIASLLDVEPDGELLLEELQERLDLIRHKLKFIENKPTVVCIEWLDPLMISGKWVPELVKLAGGIPVLSEAGEHSPYIEWIDLRLADPDIIVVMPSGFSIERTLGQIDGLLQLPGFADLQAVKNKRLYIAEGNQYFNRSGPRIVDSAEILAEIIYPKQFIFGYEGNGWIKFDV